MSLDSIHEFGFQNDFMSRAFLVGASYHITSPHMTLQTRFFFRESENDQNDFEICFVV